MKKVNALSLAVVTWLSMPLISCVYGVNADTVTTKEILVTANAAQEAAKYESQQVQIITHKDIEEKQAKTVEDIIFTQTGVSKTVDAMGRVGVSIRGAEPRHTLILVDGQPVMGDLSKYSGAMDEMMRLGTENVDHIEVIQGAASAKYGSDAIGGVINIITKSASKTPTLQFNGESLRVKGDQGLAPYSNYFLRADSGDLGNLRVALYGSKRDIVPVYASEKPTQTWITPNEALDNFSPNALRYYGIANNIGTIGTLTIDEHNSLNWHVDRYIEDLHREVKHTDSDMEPQQIFKRKAQRNSYSLGWKGTKGNTNWNFETNYSRMNEDDVSLINYYGRSSYEGKNELKYVDDIDHRQWNVNATINTQVNDAHVLTYGFGYTKETGDGSRLKSSPHTSTRYIDPWNYDKQLMVEGIDAYYRRDGDTSVPVWSHIHDYAFYDNGTSMPQWDQDYEYYGADRNNPVTLPEITYSDYENYNLKEKELWIKPEGMSDEKWQAYNAFQKRLEKENPGFYGSNIIGKYFEWGMATDPEIQKKAPKLNGKHFLEEYRNRNNRITVGHGDIKKHNFFIQDTWQVNDNTLVTPILRYDHSSLFGSNISGNLGLTYNLNGNPHRRFKANVGTGYTEPGMGELWYNWEMYGSNPVGIGIARMGWYWAGNPDLQPEKSFNIDIGIEGENKNTYARLGAFHNVIRDYMTVYFTGKYMDFAPNLYMGDKWMQAPDLIYSFKNIGKAEITGVEAEVKQKLGKHWDFNLGYTWLHAINKSDPDMPRQLLDKPVHKVDIGLKFHDDASGWSGSLWGDYYIHMLDSNTVADSNNYWPNVLHGDAAVFRKSQYEKKTFGLWNIMVQKKLNKDSLMYIGIHNIFNHRDDDRATQQRVYRFGVNVKLGVDARHVAEGRKDSSGKAITPEEAAKSKKPLLNDFILRPFDEMKGEGVDVLGDYRIRWDSHDGQNRQLPPFRADTMIADSAKKNMYDKKDHDFEQRLRLGVDARIASNTNVKVLGSASGASGIDTASGTLSTKGLNHQRLDQLDVTQHVHKWDFSIGRLTEPMGVTGYWFGKEFDGGRAVWTGKDTQVRLGYGSFEQSTGIQDSAYTHSVHAVFYRPPTISELFGLNADDWPFASVEEQAGKMPGDSDMQWYDDEHYDKGSPNDIYNKLFKGKEANVYFYQQLRDAIKNGATVQQQADLIRRVQQIVKTAYPKEADAARVQLEFPKGANVVYRVKNKKTGDVRYKVADVLYKGYDLGQDTRYINKVSQALSISLNNENVLKNGKEYLKNHEKSIKDSFTLAAKHSAETAWALHTGSLEKYYIKNGDSWEEKSDYVTQAADYAYDGIESIGMLNQESWSKPYTFEDMMPKLTDLFYDANFKVGEGWWGKPALDGNYNLNMPQFLSNYLKEMERVLRNADSNSKQPREALEKAIGRPILTEGTVLQRDVIPAIDKAAFIQVKKQVGSKLGLQAWYLRSLQEDSYSTMAAHNHSNDVSAFTKLANVIGVGAKYQLGYNTSISFDYGQNRTDFGRYMNGHSIYDHQRGTADFNLLGHADGGTPHFWTLRFDVGHCDMDDPGSWSAFVDYKYFQHGSFFGGNGTGAVPDRYLDGIRSFTIGGRYVPARNLLLEAFYTFDAKGIHQRDTLYGPESFTLGDYTRVQLTYQF